jgi:catechol 2,3-dioxygenase-like lactoylglutathione lyase family enzyme
VTRFQPLGLDHVVLRVRDQEVSRRFYTEILGCTLDHMNERISLMQLRFGAQLIDLLPAAPRRRRDGEGSTTSVCPSSAPISEPSARSCWRGPWRRG